MQSELKKKNILQKTRYIEGTLYKEVPCYSKMLLVI